MDSGRLVIMVGTTVEARGGHRWLWWLCLGGSGGGGGGWSAKGEVVVMRIRF